MSAPPFDRYLRYDDLSQILHEIARTHPQLVALQSIGKSYEGRDIWLLSVTSAQTGRAEDKPAFWVDGNLHAAELVGSSACLYFLHTLVSRYGRDADITRCLDTRAFYICPRVNPDGAEWALADRPKLVRSSVRPYPYSEAPIGGLRVEDIDGDGRILTMRLRDPNGAWKRSPQDPRLLVPREPHESGAEYFRLLPEGRIDRYDGATIQLQAKREGLDLNRNYPGRWREEHEQQGAGHYPASEPEVRATVDFIVQHPNICGGVTFHSYSGALLRPFSYQADNKLPGEDLWTYQTIGEKGTALTGYPNVSVYHDFRYHPDEVITGALDDWLYEYRGLFAWTVEIWSPQRQAGIKDFKLFDWYRKHPPQDDMALLQWNDTALGGSGYVAWYPFKHPELGDIELGGWNALYTFWNPPPALLQKEISLFPEWLVWHCLISPKLELLEAKAERIGADLYKVRLVVHNTGWLPTYVTKQGLKKNIARGVLCEIELPAGAVLVGGEPRVEVGQLEGRAYKNCSPTGWAAGVADTTSDRAKIEWIVSAAPGVSIAVRAWHDRGGRVQGSVRLR